MRDAVILVHVCLGALALASAVTAVGARTLLPRPRLHALAGRAFTLAMVGIFVTALVIVSFAFNGFLALVALFSVYLALSGFLIARNRQPRATRWQKVLSAAALCVAVLMLGSGGLGLVTGDELAVVLLAFGTLMGVLAAQECWYWATASLSGPARVAAHLSRMLGGPIALLTASAVVNLDIEPRWLAWLLPSFLIVPLIIGWNLRLRRPAAAPAGGGARVEVGS